MDDRLRRMELRLEAAERRAEQSERRCRRLLVGVGIAVVTFAAQIISQSVATAQAAKTKPLKVTKLTAPMQVVDQRGAILLMVENARPGPRLQLFGSAGTPIAELTMTEQGGGKVTVFDRTGKPAFTQPPPPAKK